MNISKIELAKLLWPINRSITGEGVRKTLKIIKSILHNLIIKSVKSGEIAYDWTVPEEWSIKDAWIKDENGKKIVDFKSNNLHVVGYSISVNKKLGLAELSDNLYTLPNQPDAIPYVTSYYKKHWGFCLTQNQKNSLKEGIYHVSIESSHTLGHLNYGELFIPSTKNTESEIFLSTYICHPSMANNEISGPVVITYLAKWLYSLKERNYNYRIVYIPETIGSIVYISKNIVKLKKNVIAGYNVTCVGDNRTYSYLPSRNGKSISDKVAIHVLKHIYPKYNAYTWEDRGSDERQYCAPGVDLPIASIMRSKYGEYDEYHTSKDTIGNVVTAEGLEGGFNALKLSLEIIEKNFYPICCMLGEPQLGKRNLYPTLSKKEVDNDVKLMMNIITWSDGKHDLIDIADKCNVPVWKIFRIVDTLFSQNIINAVEDEM